MESLKQLKLLGSDYIMLLGEFQIKYPEVLLIESPTFSGELRVKKTGKVPADKATGKTKGLFSRISTGWTLATLTTVDCT